MDKKRIANNILELLLNPTVVPVERRVYHRPEEILRNEVYEQAKASAKDAYGDQKHNADFYPLRNRAQTRKEAGHMDRRTLVASLDILSKNFQEGDPIAKDLRTMAYAVSKMADDDLVRRLAAEAPDFEGLSVEAKVETFECPKCGSKVLQQTEYCVKCKAKVKPKEAAEEQVEEVVEASEGVSNDFWSREASEAVSRAILADVQGVKVWDEKKDEKPAKKEEPVAAKKEEPSKEEASEMEVEAGKKKGPGVPDGTGPMKDTPACPMSKGADDEEKSEEPEEKEEMEEEKEESVEAGTKESKEVDTDILASTEIEGLEFNSNAVLSSDEVELSDSDRAQLNQLFHSATGNMTDAEKDKFDQLFR